MSAEPWPEARQPGAGLPLGLQAEVDRRNAREAGAAADEANLPQPRARTTSSPPQAAPSPPRPLHAVPEGKPLANVDPGPLDDGWWDSVLQDDDGAADTPPPAGAPAAPAQPERPTPANWGPTDLGPYLDGTHEPCEPTLLRRTDGPHLLYPGRVHWLAGEPEALKSWLALLACVEVLDHGGQVMFIDFEDGPAGVVGRLLALGVDPQVIAARFDYRSPDGALRHAERDALAGDVAAADLLVVDACTEALAAQGLSSKDDVDVASWLALLPRWAARLGPAVVVLDHVVKDSENRGRWATGSQHKLAGLDGVAFTLESVQPGGVGMVGRSRLYVSKDRHGQVRPHAVPSSGGKAWLADLVVDSSGPFTEAVLHPPTTQQGPFVPTLVMGKVSDVLVAAGRQLSKSEIEDRVGGRAAVVRQALAALEDAGHIEVTSGSHNSRQHRLLKAYPEAVEQP